MPAVLVPTLPPFQTPPQLRRFTVAEYQRLIDTGVIGEDDRVELIDGYMVYDMPANPPHEAALTVAARRLDRLCPPGYHARNQVGALIDSSRPQPDVAVVRGDENAYRTRHPEPPDILLLVEVADSSLQWDRMDKGRVYARASVPEYWVVNLNEGQIEVYTDPTGPVAAPVYRIRRDFPGGTAVPVVLDGATVGTVAVSDVIA